MKVDVTMKNTGQRQVDSIAYKVQIDYLDDEDNEIDDEVLLDRPGIEPGTDVQLENEQFLTLLIDEGVNLSRYEIAIARF